MRAPAPLLAATAIISLQFGAGLAGRLFTQVPPAAVTGLRMWSAAVLLALLGARGLRAALTGRGCGQEGITGRDWLVAASFGLALAAMNFSVYQAIARIPLGIAVTIEFLGPLAVAVAMSRRLSDLLWVILALAGVVLLGRGGPGLAHGGLAHGHGAALAGVLFALVSAACWAAYIVLSAATGKRFAGPSGLVIAMVFGAVLTTPAAVTSAGAALLRPGVLAAGAAIGLMSSAIPYWLELETLRRVPARVFGIWMSLQPAGAALAGLVMLGEVLAPWKWLGIGLVMAASAGAAATARPVHPVPDA
ncbi:MAG TPA: EamA family transporter [Streptosporangiaceae bacterium]|nr:EamA family transporter [Streptosporangiaceae bacterium]